MILGFGRGLRKGDALGTGAGDGGIDFIFAHFSLTGSLPLLHALGNHAVAHLAAQGGFVDAEAGLGSFKLSHALAAGSGDTGNFGFHFSIWHLDIVASAGLHQK